MEIQVTNNIDFQVKPMIGKIAGQWTYNPPKVVF